MSLKNNVDENKQDQEKLREIQLKRDNGKTFGHDYKDPCKKEKEMSLTCIELSHDNSLIDCKAYFDNYKKCKQFWSAVQEYRSRVLKKRKEDLPDGEEYEKWKKQLPNWILTKKITPPEDDANK